MPSLSPVFGNSYKYIEYRFCSPEGAGIVRYAYSDQEVLLMPREETGFWLNAVIPEKGILSF
jgi:hypothetical protein